MRGTKINLTLATVLVAGLIGVLAGCSEQMTSPLGSASVSGNGGIAPSSQTEISGRVAQIDSTARTLSIQGNSTPVLVNANAQVVSKVSGTEVAITLGQIHIGDSVDVRGSISQDTLRANRVRRRSSGQEVEFGGRVISIDTVTSTLSMTTAARVIADSLTEITYRMYGSETTIPFSKIKPGDSLEVKGFLNPDSSVSATRLRVRDDYGKGGGGSDVEFTSEINFIDYTAMIFTVKSRPDTIHVDSLTHIFSRTRGRHSGGDSYYASEKGSDSTVHDEEIPFTDLQVGLIVEVHANITPAGLLAARIDVEDGEEGEINDGNNDGIEREFKATITAIDSSARTLTFSDSLGSGVVLPDAEITGLLGDAITFGDLAIGQLVEAKGIVVNSTFMISRVKRDDN